MPKLVLDNRMIAAAVIACETLAKHYKDQPGLMAQMTYEAMAQTAEEIRRQAPETKIAE